ncbi:MAG TPA: caspase family protein [Thermotogota bacterium]|nr:caspase family protein [Thermotogota bacterium]HQC37258.1 caspase family protein [Thermotogota bacterium]
MNRRVGLRVFTVLVVLFMVSGCTVLYRIFDPLNPTPSAESRTSATTVLLRWEYPEGSDVTFDVYLGTSSNTMALIARDLTDTFVTVSQLIPNTRYYWKVKVQNAFGQYRFSQVWSFDVIGGKRYALMIGVSDYDVASDLRWTVNDANDVQTCLEHLSGEFINQQLLTRVVEDDVVAVFEELEANFSDADTFLFYFAGHGSYDYAASESYLSFSNGSKITVSELRNLIARLDGTVFVVLDSCRSGGFTSLLSSREEVIADLEKYNRSFIEGLTQGTRSGQTYVLTAAKQTESSWEDATLQNGIFSFFFADGLGHTGLSAPLGAFNSTYDADVDSNKQITLDEVYDYTFANVNTYLKNIQQVQVFPVNSNYIVAEWE